MNDEKLEGFFAGMAFMAVGMVIMFLVCGSALAATHAVTIEYADATELAAKIDSALADSCRIVNIGPKMFDWQGGYLVDALTGKPLMDTTWECMSRKFLQWIEGERESQDTTIMYDYGSDIGVSFIPIRFYGPYRGILLYDDGEGK